MKFNFAAILLSFVILGNVAQADTTISFQGQLDRQGSPFTGETEMTFRLFNAETDGDQIGSDQEKTVSVENGIFTVELDFGRVFGGSPRWMEIELADAILGDRQRITSVPTATNASQGGGTGNTLTGANSFVAATALSTNAGVTSGIVGGVNNEITADGGGALLVAAP